MHDFEKQLIDKIDNGESLSESEIRTFVWEVGEEVSKEYGENRRWSRMVYLVKKVDDRFFSISYDEGLTEKQENEYYEQPYEVFKEEHQETITVTNWTKVEKKKEVKEETVKMNELQIVINETPAIINDNFAEVKESLANMMQAYEGLTYTDDTVKDARADVATLRKIRKAIDDKRKEVKKAHMIPYEVFESKAKELIEIIDNTINPINQQIEEYTVRRREERKEEISNYFYSKIGAITCLSFEEVFLESWITNMSTSMKSIKAAIDNRIAEVEKDLESIKAFQSEVEEKALAAYAKTKVLADAIHVISDYEREKAEILRREEERRRAEEERRRQEEERRRIEEEARKARIEAARKAEEERKAREEAERIEREKQEAIEEARRQERERIQEEIRKQKEAEVKRMEAEGLAREQAEREAEEARRKEQQQLYEGLPFGNPESEPEHKPEIEQQQEEATEQKQDEPADTGLPFDTEPATIPEVRPIATSQVRYTVTAPQEKLERIEQFMLNLCVPFDKEEGPF